MQIRAGLALVVQTTRRSLAANPRLPGRQESQRECLAPRSQQL
jgi:hypothetical protein